MEEPEPQPELRTGDWYVHRLGDQPLPAIVAQTTVDGRIRRTYLDSARLSITAAGQWDQRLYLETWEDNEFVGSSTLTDVGSWSRTDSGYVFVSETRGPRHVIRSPSRDSLKLVLDDDELPAAPAATLRRQTPPPLINAVWRATHVRDLAIPAALYVWDPTIVDGREVSAYLIVDSARIAIHPTGRYVHHIWASEWIGDVGGPPRERRFSFQHGDFGGWDRSGTDLGFDSHWLENHTMTGTFALDGILRMRHGFSHGDERADFRYAH